MQITDENRSIFKKQIVRLSGLAFFRNLPEEALDELAAALAESSDNFAEAETRIKIWLMFNTEVPRPADFYRMAMEAKTAAETVPFPTGCPKCKDSGLPGFIRRETGLGFCSCPLGRAKREANRRMDEDYKRSAAAPPAGMRDIADLSPQGLVS